MYKLIIFYVLAFILFCATVVNARNGWQGCCSWHGGIAGYCSNGRMVCNDGTLSPSCFCDDPGEYSYSMPMTPRDNHTYGYSSSTFSKGYWFTSPLPTHSNGSIILVTSFPVGESDVASLVFDISKTNLYRPSWCVKINKATYNVTLRLDIPFDHYNGQNPVKLYYSIDGKKFTEVNVESSVKLIGCISVYFYVDVFSDLYYGLRRGNIIRFKLENNGWRTTLDYPLTGFSYVYDNSISYLENLNQ